MAARAVQVSIDEDLLRRVDAQPETRERGRSAFVRSAIEGYLRARKRREIDRAISSAFGTHADAMLDEVDELPSPRSRPRSAAPRPRQSELTRFVGTVGPAKMQAICRALATACDCD